jgi:hypothetical protein
MQGEGLMRTQCNVPPTAEPDLQKATEIGIERLRNSQKPVNRRFFPAIDEQKIKTGFNLASNL